MPRGCQHRHAWIDEHGVCRCGVDMYERSLTLTHAQVMRIIRDGEKKWGR